ncbi:hypothetical protein, partial [Chitiniphilus eburneus]
GNDRAPQVRALLPAPGLNGAQARYDALPIVLTLAPQDGAHGYWAQVAEDAAFTRIGQEVRGAGPTLRLDGLADGRHVVRLRVLDADDLPGAVLEHAFLLKTTPIAPLPQTPAQDAVVAAGRVEIQCSGIPDAAGFLLQYGPDADFADGAVRSEQAHTCRFTIDAAEAGVLHWRVATLEATVDGVAERGPFSDVSRFSVVPAPQAPAMALDAGEVIQAHWAAVPDTRFLVQLARDTAFAEVVAETTVSEPRVTFDLGARCRPYFIRLQAINQYDMRSAFSPARRVDPDRAVCDSTGDPVLQQDGRSVRRATL